MHKGEAALRVVKAMAFGILAIAMAASPGWSKTPAPPPELNDIPVAMLVDLGSGQILLSP